MSKYRSLIERLEEDPDLRAALAAAASPEARAEVVRAAGLELPDADEILEGVAGGNGGNGSVGNGGNGARGISTLE